MCASAALALLASTGSAHSVKDVESLLGSREQYFQAIEKDTPDFSLQDADGRAIDLAGFRGKVVVLHFIYAGCPDACPLHAERLAEVQEMVNQTPMKDQAQFISITTDPTNDTPDVLRDYGGQHGLDPSNWVFLTKKADQPEDVTRQLAESFGHKFMKTEDGYQIHGIVTHIIDKEGRWRANFHGLRFQPTNMVVFVNALVNDYHHDGEAKEAGIWSKVRRWLPSW